MVTRPSAGAMTSFSPRGVVRTGSRKKVATQTVSPISSHASVCQWTANASKTAAPTPTAYFRPSGWTEGKRHLTVVVGSGLSCLSRLGIARSLVALRWVHNGAVASPRWRS